MRHSIATAAVNAGADLEAVSAFLGHKNPKTTRRFYATHGAVRRVPTLNDAPAAPPAKSEAQ
jgi:site-specific recombinase XerD